MRRNSRFRYEPRIRGRGGGEREVWDRLAGRYDRIIPWFDGRYGAVRERLARDLAGAGRVLEVGAGTGQFTTQIASAAREVLATDLSPAMVERLRARVAAGALAGVEVRVMAADALELPDGGFDAVVAANLLHVMERPERALDEFRRVLRGGGLLLAPTFCHGQTLRARLTSSALSLVSPFVAHARFSAPSLARVVASRGFQVEACENLGGWLPEVYLRARSGRA